MLLYKFRAISGESFRFTQDIFINRRLYLPTAMQLNDPNEGVAVVDIQNAYRAWGNQLEERNRRNSTRICSLTEQYRSSVVWAHYADQHKGICIEIDSAEINTGCGILMPVQYTKNVPILGHNTADDVRRAFLNKTNEWGYEQEWRYVTSEQPPSLLFTESAITRVMLGARFNSSDIPVIEYWLRQYAPTRSIPIVAMKFASTDYSLYEEGEMQGKIERIG